MIGLVTKRAPWLPAPFCQLSLKVISSNILLREIFIEKFFQRFDLNTYKCYNDVIRKVIEERRVESKNYFVWKYDGVVMLNGGFLLISLLQVERLHKQKWGRL